MFKGKSLDKATICLEYLLDFSYAFGFIIIPLISIYFVISLAVFLKVDLTQANLAYYNNARLNRVAPRLHLENLHHKNLIEQPASPEIINAVLVKCKDEDKCDDLVQQARQKYAKGLLLRDRSLRGINLKKSNLYNIDLQNSDLSGASAGKSNFYKSDLTYTILNHADLHEADLQEANPFLADLHSANLQEANLQEATLYKANLQGANLYKVDLYKAWPHSANLQGADLQGATLHGADLSESIYNNKTVTFSGLFFDINPTVFPEDFDPIKRKMLNICNKKHIQMILNSNNRLIKDIYFDIEGNPTYKCVEKVLPSLKSPTGKGKPRGPSS